ncbi:C-type lectin domain family 4 member F-like isoform X2 [Mercenaria mercenaria]|uniref:C-type lectin domain family 4 member F-like isoform X2 n=1 Tax=Mercenaria mercenaria TaxID=6596 RepID=UPI00234F1269|nr:C-type lectin domain family 4 member F-like isoform X2 [Mercenaria mercenaria]
MALLTQIWILLLMTCAWNVDAKSLMKRRLNTLETRVNSIEEDIEALNSSFVILEDQACECSNVRAENGGQIKQNLGQSVVSHQSETRIKKTFLDEKRWLRQKVKIMENEMRKVTNQVENNNDMFAEAMARMQIKENDLDRKLHEAISEVMKNCSDEIVSREKNNNDLFAETVTRMQVKENELDRKLNEAISEAMANYSAEIRKKDEKMDEQQVEIDNLKQLMNETKKVSEDLLVTCPDGWAEFQSFCYLYVKEKQTYVSARETCLKLGASVADIQSSSENGFVYKLCENNGHTWTSTLNEGRVWIGLTDEETEGTGDLANRMMFLRTA